MAKEMLINVSEGEECRIALLEDGKLEELYMERTSSTSHVGNIYKGRVTNVEPSIQAAFVDFGLGRNGFLHISDLMPTYFGRKGEDIQESVGRKMARRDRPPIQRCLRRGDEIIVQIIKEGIGTKGPTLSTYLSIPGRILVMMPGMGKFGVSRKIEDDDERRRLRTILDSLKPLKDVGFIIRTAGIGKTKTDIQRDLTYLTRLWQNIEKKMQSGPGPMELYTEGDLVTRTVRDVFSSDIDHIVVDNKEVAKRVKEVIKLSNPRTKNKVELYEGLVPIFHEYGIEREIEQMYTRHVPLPSGGSLVIDSTEAIVAIDVNSGKFRDHADAETTAFKTDMEAADEISRQLKLRDLGGVIICDFIDLRFERHRRELEKKLHDNLKKDRAKTKVLRMSQFGIIEMTRQRMRPSLKRSVYFDCPHCKGTGLVKTPESMSLDVMRKLAIAIADQRVMRVELIVCPEVAFYLLNRKRAQLAALEERYKARVVVRQDQRLGLDEIQLELFDSREGLVYLEELGMTPFGQSDEPRRGQPQRQHQRGGGQPQRNAQPQRGGGRGGRPGLRPHDRRQDAREREQERDRDREREEDRYDLDRVEEDVDQREEAHDDARRDALAPADDNGAPRAQPLAPSQIRGARPPARTTPLDDDDENESDESHVIEVDEPHEPMGEGPRAFDEGPRDGGNGNGGRRRRRRRGRRGRGRGRGQQQPFGSAAGGGYGGGGYGGGGYGESGHGQQPAHPAGGYGHEPDLDESTSDRDADDARERPTSVSTQSEFETHGSGEVETESIEATFEDDDAPSAAAAGSGRDAAQAESGTFPGEALVGEQPDGGRRRRRRRGGRRHRRRREAAAAENGTVGETETPATEFAETDASNESGQADAGDLETVPPELIEAAPEHQRRTAERVVEKAPPLDSPAIEEAVEARSGKSPSGEAPLGEAPSDESPSEEAPSGEPPAEERPAKRPRRSRAATGGTPRGRRTKSASQRTPPSAASAASAASSSAPPPEPVVPRSGSTDRHLMHEDNVDTSHHEPPRRPRSYRDLDAIPDDFD